MDEAKKLIVLEQENEELKRELREYLKLWTDESKLKPD